MPALDEMCVIFHHLNEQFYFVFCFRIENSLEPVERYKKVCVGWNLSTIFGLLLPEARRLALH
jgi:hypothetical protein